MEGRGLRLIENFVRSTLTLWILGDETPGRPTRILTLFKDYIIAAGTRHFVSKVLHMSPI